MTSIREPGKRARRRAPPPHRGVGCMGCRRARRQRRAEAPDHVQTMIAGASEPPFRPAERQVDPERMVIGRKSSLARKPGSARELPDLPPRDLPPVAGNAANLIRRNARVHASMAEPRMRPSARPEIQEVAYSTLPHPRHGRPSATLRGAVSSEGVRRATGLGLLLRSLAPPLCGRPAMRIRRHANRTCPPSFWNPKLPPDGPACAPVWSCVTSVALAPQGSRRARMHGGNPGFAGPTPTNSLA